MAGGIAQYLFTKDITSRAGAVASLSFYFLLPFSILYSRVLMPGPIMVASTAIAVWALYTWEKHRTVQWAVAAGLIAGFAVFTKSVGGFCAHLPLCILQLRNDPNCAGFGVGLQPVECPC
jgi:4-amino-4-deoxy-L-arabinose transferase-like glycosyltransferase